MLSGLQSQPLSALARDGLLAEVGEGCIFVGIDDALWAARHRGRARRSLAGRPPSGGGESDADRRRADQKTTTFAPR